MLNQNLLTPVGPVDVVLDTDTFNEVDDQFALSYLLHSEDKLTTRAVYAAPFFNRHSTSPADGMERSYQEILHILKLNGREDLNDQVFRGSTDYLADEHTPQISPATLDLANRAMQYSPEKPLYVVAIGAITNVASALLLAPEIAENIVVVWLGGNARHREYTREFNMRQDVAAARVVMANAPFVQLPCAGVVSEFRISAPELDYWLVGKNELTDYLAGIVKAEAESYAKGKPWTRVIWDVTAVAWLLNDDDRFMHSVLMPVHLPDSECRSEEAALDRTMAMVVEIKRDRLMDDLFSKLTNA